MASPKKKWLRMKAKEDEKLAEETVAADLPAPEPAPAVEAEAPPEPKPKRTKKRPSRTRRALKL